MLVDLTLLMEIPEDQEVVACSDTGNSGGAGNTPSVTPPQGNNGGNKIVQRTSTGGGGGGGGGGSAAVGANSVAGPSGGAGQLVVLVFKLIYVEITITGVAVVVVEQFKMVQPVLEMVVLVVVVVAGVKLLQELAPKIGSGGGSAINAGGDGTFGPNPGPGGPGKCRWY